MVSWAMFQDENQHENKDQSQQAQNAFEWSGILLCLFRSFQLLNTSFGGFHHGFHIVINPIQYGSLINHQHGQFFKNSSQFFNALGNFNNFFIP